MLSRSLLFFFFQAEDGIRDFHVTGVQTCALPISTSTGGASFLTCMSPSKGNDGQRVKSGKGAVLSGTSLTLAQATGHCPGSISREVDDRASAVRVAGSTSRDVTVCGHHSTP